ncbi:hypothetical protein ACFVWR_07780 [Leifsonia sp. NPDC058292]|uniref:hypothetical protein n=1 Tax=Leifsonia sp. NPDC058292 TaxID=3346428 RepID=UPI0036DCA00A
MSFFPPDPPDDRTDTPDQAPTPWWKPSDEELPAVLPVGETIASNDTVALILSAARVFSNGVEFVIDRRLRRGGSSVREWRQMQFEMHGHYAESDEERLRYGVVLGDGERLILDVSAGMFGDASDTHRLTPTGGGGGGSEDFYRFEDGMWLWPLPPEGPLEVVAQWPAFGVPESRVVIDSASLLALATHARPVWP